MLTQLAWHFSYRAGLQLYLYYINLDNIPLISNPTRPLWTYVLMAAELVVLYLVSISEGNIGQSFHVMRRCITLKIILYSIITTTIKLIMNYHGFAGKVQHPRSTSWPVSSLCENVCSQTLLLFSATFSTLALSTFKPHLVSC